MDDEQLNHICWLIVYEISEAVPFEKVAEINCENVKGKEFEEEVNYLAGSAESLNEIAEMLYEYDVNVIDRALEYDQGELELDREKIKDYLGSNWIENID